MADVFAQLRAAAAADRAAPLEPAPSNSRYAISAADVQGLLSLRQEAVVREQPEPLDGRDAAGASTRTCRDPRASSNGVKKRALRLHPLPQGRQGAEGRLATPLDRAPSSPAAAGLCVHCAQATFRAPCPSKSRRGTRTPHRPSRLGRITIASDAIAADRGTHGGRVLRRRRDGRQGAEAPARARPADPGIEVSTRDGGLALDLYVVVEYGLNLAEVAATVRSRVAYEVERLTGLTVAAVEVHIQDVTAIGVTELERARELAQGVARDARGEPAPDRRPERLPRARRRHRHEPDADRARDRRGARGARPPPTALPSRRS